MAIKKSELYSSLWSSCDELRGGMDASQYKDYVLVMLFVKYVSDKYVGVHYAPITIPEGASFKDMIALKGRPSIGDDINKKIIAPLANANKLSDMPDFNDATKLGSGKEMVDRLTNLIAIFENKALDFSKNRADGDDTPAEQEAISDALSDADALIESLEQLIAKKRHLKQGAMQELLTGKKRLPGFIGEWEVKRLGDVAEIDPDNLGSATPADYTFNYISLEDVDSGSLRSYSEQVFRSAPSRARRRLRAGDILVSTVRPNLQSHLLFASAEPTWICSTGFSVVRCKMQDAAPGYIFCHFFGHLVTKQIEALLTGSNYPAINGRDAKALEIPLPSLPEQTAIATILSDMDTEIAALEAKLAKTRHLKQGMMHNLLTGKIRLV